MEDPDAPTGPPGTRGPAGDEIDEALSAARNALRGWRMEQLGADVGDGVHENQDPEARGSSERAPDGQE